MIIGGVGGVLRTGGAYCGLSMKHFPVSVDFGRANIDGIFAGARPIGYSATAKINDGTKDIPLGDVTNFQISANIEGGGNAGLTVRNTEKWGISKLMHPDLLRPSNNILTITMHLTLGATQHDVDVFVGAVESYSESHGAKNGAISLSCRPASVSILGAPYAATGRRTAFRALNDALESTGRLITGQGLVMMIADKATTSPDFSSIADLINYVTLSNVRIEERTAGGLKLDMSTSEEASGATVFTVSDSNANSITRSVGARSAFNTVTVWGLDEFGEPTTATVQDAEDVAKRGVLRHSVAFGDPEQSIDANIVEAEAFLAIGLRGRISVQLALNPYLRVGDLINFSSDRLGINNAKAKVNRLQHQYSLGSAQTWLSEMSLL